MDRAARRPSCCCQRAVAVVLSRAKSPRPVFCRWVAVAASSAPLAGSPGFADDCFLSRATEASPALARARSRYGPMDKARRICKNANVQDYGSRDSVYAYITREDLVRIPVAIFFFFFCPLDHLRRGKPNSGVWCRIEYPSTVRAPREIREVPRRRRQVAEGPRGTRRACCRAMGGASTACGWLASPQPSGAFVPLVDRAGLKRTSPQHFRVPARLPTAG